MSGTSINVGPGITIPVPPAVDGGTLEVVITVWGTGGMTTIQESYVASRTSGILTYIPVAPVVPVLEDSGPIQPDEPSYGGPGAIDLTADLPAGGLAGTETCLRTPRGKRGRRCFDDPGQDIRNRGDSGWYLLRWSDRLEKLTEACRPFVSVSTYDAQKTLQKAREISSLIDAVEFVKERLPPRKRRRSTKRPRVIDAQVGSAATAVFAQELARKKLRDQWQGGADWNPASSPPIECMVCFEDCPPATVATCTLNPGHPICGSCVHDLSTKAGNPRSCVHPGCQGELPEKFVQEQLTPLERMNLVEADGHRAVDAVQNGGDKVVHCPQHDCRMSYSFPANRMEKFKCICGTILCLTCNKVHADFDAPCKINPADADVGLGSFAQETNICICGRVVSKNGGCDHLTCVCGRDLCDGCGRPNSVESICPGAGEWHETRFKCPISGCNLVQHEVDDPKGVAVSCNGCQALLIIDDPSGIVFTGGYAPFSSASL